MEYWPFNKHNQDEEDEEDDYYKLSPEEEKLLNNPPPRYFDGHMGYPEWRQKNEKYALLKKKLNKEKIKREMDLISRMNKNSARIIPKDKEEDGYYEDRDDDFDENGIRRDLSYLFRR